MPGKPLRPCSRPGCPNLTRVRYCPEHERQDAQRQAQQLYDQQRGSAAARGYDAEWRKIRAQVLQEQPWCACSALATEVDHLVALEAGGTNERENLVGRCKRCHSRKTAKYDGAFGNPRRRG